MGVWEWQKLRASGPSDAPRAHRGRGAFMGLQTGGQVAGALAGAHGGPVRRQDLGMWGHVYLVLLLQGRSPGASGGPPARSSNGWELGGRCAHTVWRAAPSGSPGGSALPCAPRRPAARALSVHDVQRAAGRSRPAWALRRPAPGGTRRSCGSRPARAPGARAGSCPAWRGRAAAAGTELRRGR